MASDHSGGGCNKRYRQDSSCADDDIGEMSNRSKRCCGVAPSSGANDDGAGAYNDSCSDGGTGEDYMFESDGYDDDDQAEEDASACEEEEQRYIVLTEDVIRARQEADTAKVAEVLSIPTGFAAVLLRHFKWRIGRVQEEWFSDDRRVRDAVGLLADGGLVPTTRSPRPKFCAICFDEYPAGRMRSAGCSHYYCDDCWREYMCAAVGDGARCLSLRCPDPSCSAAVVRELVDEVADGADRARYAQFWLRSYVEESGGRMRWCAGPGCTRAVKFLGFAGDGAADVFCECRHGFCWSCGEEAHRPVSCDTVRAWQAKNVSDSETANWLLTHTKHCPKCQRPIEKNQGCNHMTCRPPCGHHFCWLCFDPWYNHYRCSRYDYERQQEPAGEEETRRRQAKASIDRYLYHYERWLDNRESLQRAVADMDQLQHSGLQEMAAALEIKVADLEFLTKAYELIADGRRVMRWVYAYGYYLDPDRDAAERCLFDQLQGDANSWLERLHDCAELERIKFCRGDEGGAAMNEMYRVYKKKLEDLTKATRTYFRNLVKAFETGLPEFNSVK
ncbi:unnamed protein product [Urochloa humidicola]